MIVAKHGGLMGAGAIDKLHRTPKIFYTHVNEIIA